MSNPYEYDDFPNDSPGTIARSAARLLCSDFEYELADGATVEDALADIDELVMYLERWREACRKADRVLRVQP